jgi:carboxypeptidase C (cathepsin A)
MRRLASQGLRVRAMTAFFLATMAAGMVSAAHVQPDATAAVASAKAFAPTATRTLAARPPVVTTHRATIAGRSMAYQAVVNEWPVPGSDGKPVGVIVTEAYIAKQEPAASRPVTFIYNGGPGSSSWALQMEGFGPKIYQVATGRFVDNPDSLLDASDLVFIDPLGTGASFPLANRDASSVWNTPGDASSILDVIDRWLKDNGRTTSPQFLMGESYGTMRSVAITHADAQRKALHLNGVILLSLFLKTPENDDISAIALLPSLAASAYVRGLRPIAASSVEDAYAQASLFARTEYASALLEGSALSTERLNTIARDMSEQIGVPPGVLAGAHLRLDRNVFAHALLEGHGGGHTGSLDTRQTGGADIDALPAPYNDPSMTLGKRPENLFETYLKSLNYTAAAPYRYLNLAINRGNWFFSVPSAGDGDDPIDTLPWLADAMKANPSLRLFTAGGYFDTNTPVGVGVYQLNHADIDRARWTAKAYASGHGITEDAVQRAKLAGDLRTFVRQSVETPGM